MTSFNSIKYLMLLVLTAGLTVFSSCNKDDDDDNTPENEQELITTVTLTFVDQNNVSSVFKAFDLDGPGGDDPVIPEVILQDNETYQLFVAFLDESDLNDVEDITEEVEEESNEHLVCFEASGFNTPPLAQDTDDNGDPLGLESSLTTGDLGTGSLRVILRHEPDKSIADPCTTGETDVDVTFPVRFQ